MQPGHLNPARALDCPVHTFIRIHRLRATMETPLLRIAKEMARKEKIAKEFKRRIRFKGKVIEKTETKKGNIRLLVKKGEEDRLFVVIKSHKARFALAQSIAVGEHVSAEGIAKFRAIICTKLKRIGVVDESRQETLESFKSQ